MAAEREVLIGSDIAALQSHGTVDQNIVDIAVDASGTVFVLSKADGLAGTVFDQSATVAALPGATVVSPVTSRSVRIGRPVTDGQLPATNRSIDLLAVDTVGAGFHELVLLVSGSSARMAGGFKDSPIDSAIIGIVDTVRTDADEPRRVAGSGCCRLKAPQAVRTRSRPVPPQ